MLFDYQEKGIDWLIKVKRGILADRPGLGKTAQSLTAAVKVNAKRVLVICPNSLKINWKHEVEIWAPDYIPIILTSGNINAALTLIKEKMREKGSKFIIIINYEAVLNNIPQLTFNWDVLIVDEAHRLKNYKSKTYKAVYKLNKWCTYLFMLTGTPVLGHVTELWAPLSILFPREFTSYWKFAESYANIETSWGGHPKIVDILDKNHPKLIRLRDVLTGKLLRRTESVLDLPEKLYQTIQIELSGKQRDIYNQMEKDFFVLLNDKVVDSSTILANMTRLRQIALCPKILNNDLPFESSKIEALLDLIESLGEEQIIIFSHYKSFTKLLYENLKNNYSCVRHDGDINIEDRQKAIEEFQRGEKQIFICSLSTGREGINLTKGTNVIFTDKDWTPALIDQAEKRAHRIGRIGTVFIYNIIAIKTIEEFLEIVLQRKTVVAATINEGGQVFEWNRKLFLDYKMWREKNGNK